MSNSTALADERRVLPVMMAGAVRESSDPSFCCFLPSSSKAQSNAGGSRSGVKPSQKSRTGASSTSQVVYNFWKSHSEDGCRKKGKGVRTSDGFQLQGVKCAPPTAKHSLSCDESRSAALQSSSHPASPSVMDGILSSLQNRQRGNDQTELLQQPVASLQISNCAIAAGQDGSSCRLLAGGKVPFDNNRPLKAFALDPTKYQLKSSERRNVPQMGRQRRNCSGTSSNDSSYAILFEADHSNDDVAASRDNTGLCGNQQIQVSSNKQNGSCFTGSGCKDTTTMTPSQTRAHSESGVLGCRVDGSSSRSALASVSRHLSLETGPSDRSQNLMGRDQDATSGKLESWMLGPDSPDYALPFDTLVADPNVVRNSAKIDGTAAFLPQKAGTCTIQGVRACRTSGIHFTSANECRLMMKSGLIDDTGISLKSSPADPYEPDTTRNLSHCPWKGDRPADKSDMFKARSPGICPAVAASYNWATRSVATEDRPLLNVPPHLESSSCSSQNVIDTAGEGFQLLSEGPNCVHDSWNQSIPDLQNSCKTHKSSAARDSVNKVSGSRGAPNTTRIQHGQLTNGFTNLNVDRQPTKQSKVMRHTTSASAVEDVSNFFRIPGAKNPRTHLSSADCQLQCMEQSQQRAPVHTHCNMLITEYSGGDIPSEDHLRELSLRSSDSSVSVGSCLRHDNQSSSTFGRSGRPNSRRSDASTETLRDFEENENSVVKRDSNPNPNRSVLNSASDPYGHSLNSNLSYDQDRSNEVFDQNNNQQLFEEEEEEYFGTSTGSTLDWCYKWEWDSPTSTLQRSVIQRPAFQRNHSEPATNNQTKRNSNISATSSQESNPDVIPTIAPPPRLLSIKNRGHNFPGAKICYYIVSLASESEFFGAMVKNFIQCTVTGVEMNPHTVIRNIRQFIDGLKNYLMQQREAKLNEFIKLECLKINSGEFLNLDAITERALHKCVIRPLHNHINKLFVYDFTRNGNLQLMADGIKSAKTKRLFERVGPAHQSKSVEAAQLFLRRMTETYSPIKKLENLIAAVSMIAGNDTICSNQMRWSGGSTAPLRPDELLMKLMYVLVDQDMASAEVEADYIWGLIHPSFLTGERTYYLTLFCSAVALIKNLSKSSSPTMDNCLQRISAEGLLRICIPDEKQDNIWTQALPVQPNTTTTDICQMMAYKLNITNPHEYSLYLISDGEENRLKDMSNLSDVKTASHSDNHLLAYKRISAKFVWPKNRR